jgi:peptide/nickel transport system permease protein
MFRFILRKLAQLGVVLVLATFAITLLVRALPGDPATSLFPFGTPEQLDEVRRQFGLDQNIFEYYFRWLGNFVTGDFGFYYLATFGEVDTVGAVLADTLPRSLLLMFYSVTISLAISIPLAVVMAYRADSRFDRTSSNTLFALSSIPNFSLALGLSFIVAVQLGLLNPIGYEPFSMGVSAHVKSMILPVASLSLGLIAVFTRLLRADMIATLKEDFIAMAASKGLSDRYILWRHAFRPSSLTLLTSAALNMGSLIGGAVLIESVFALNGLGMYLQIAIAQRQYLAIQSIIALIAVFFMVFNTVVDVLYAYIDPRARLRNG